MKANVKLKKKSYDYFYPLCILLILINANENKNKQYQYAGQNERKVIEIIKNIAKQSQDQKKLVIQELVLKEK